ncbi:MAG TPA: hypothetical protein VN408_31570 [Actinoplanes sp.]|nr:hypothetical protein [Actinoplanes sp.]
MPDRYVVLAKTTDVLRPRPIALTAAASVATTGGDTAAAPDFR